MLGHIIKDDIENWSTIDIVLSSNADNSMDKTIDKHVNFKRYVNEKVTVFLMIMASEISWTHNEEKTAGEF